MDREVTEPLQAAEPGWRFGRDSRAGASLGYVHYTREASVIPL